MNINKTIKEEKDEIKEGVWVICCDGYYPYCSVCGYEPVWNGKDNRTHRCPNCKSIMRYETGELVCDLVNEI